jgi:hypothetical protein
MHLDDHLFASNLWSTMRFIWYDPRIQIPYVQPGTPDADPVRRDADEDGEVTRNSVPNSFPFCSLSTVHIFLPN